MQRKWLRLVLILVIASLALLVVTRLRESSQQEFSLPQNVIAVERGDILITLELTGELRPQREAFLRFPISGTVVEILVKEGEIVQAGQVLVRLEDAEQQLELLRAQRGHRRDTPSKMPLFPSVSLNVSWARELEIQLGTRALDIDWTLTMTYSGQVQWRLEANWVWALVPQESELERLERELALQRAQAALSATVLRAPFAGIVHELRVHPKDRVTETEPILTLIDPSSWIVEAPIAERDLARLIPGQQATVMFEAYEGLVLPAELVNISMSRPTEQTKQLKAHLRLLQIDPRLMPALTARALVTLQEAKNVLRVPLEAVAEINGRYLVTRVRGSQVEEVEVQTGLSDDRWVEIRSGLEEGDQILANNYRLYEKYQP